MLPVVGGPRVVLALANRRQRQHARRQLGTLADLTVAPATLRSYVDAVDRFTNYLDARAITYPRTLRALDSLLSEYLESLWFEGDPKSWAANAISGIQHFIPSARHHLPGSWRLYGPWSRREMPSRAPPILKLQVYALAHYCREQRWFSTMLLLLVGFHTLLRTGELLAMRCQDVHIDPRTGRGVIFLPFSKSAARSGARESVEVSDAWIGRLLYLFCRGKPPDQLLFLESAHVQRTRLTRALLALSLPSSLRWRSLRRGGATALYQHGAEVARIAILGRWANSRTARIYINDGLAMLHALLPSAAQRRLLLQ